MKQDIAITQAQSQNCQPFPYQEWNQLKNDVLSLKTNLTEKDNRISYLESELRHVCDKMIINNRQFCTNESLDHFFSRLLTAEAQQARFSNCACSNSFHSSNSVPKPPMLG